MKFLFSKTYADFKAILTLTVGFLGAWRPQPRRHPVRLIAASKDVTFLLEPWLMISPEDLAVVQLSVFRTIFGFGVALRDRH